MGFHMQNSLDIIFNLGMLASLSMISGIIGHNGKKWSKYTLIQGGIFGFASVIGMLNPLIINQGLIFDGRSVMLSLCGVYFGPIATLIAIIPPLVLRLLQGGEAALMGSLVILSSASIGVIFYQLRKKQDHRFQNESKMLYLMGISVHVTMVLLMFTLPEGRGVTTIRTLGLPIMLTYPIATMFIGKMLHAISENRRMTDSLKMSEQNLRESHDEIEATLEEVIAQEDEIRVQLNHLALSEERFRKMIDQAPVGINLSDFKTGIISLANEAYCELVGRPMSEVVGASWHNFTHPDDLKTNTVLNKTLVDHGLENVEMEKRYLKPDGSVIWVNVKNTIVGYGSDNSNHELTFAEDITAKKRAVDDLANSEITFRSIFENSTDTILIFEDYHIQDCNQAALLMFGFTSKSSFVGRRVESISPEYQEEGTLSSEKAIHYLKLCQTEKSIRFEWTHKKSDDSIFQVEVVLTNIILHGRSVGHALVRDISERKVLEKRLEHLSYHDQLTEIYNRRFFEEEVNRLNVARNYPLTIMMADVNGLKLINDSFGHETGDLLLKKIARLLHLSCREDDIVSRIGGDEFVILLPKTHPKKAEEIADRIQSLIATETIESIDISVSLGWAAIFSEEDHYSEVLKQAENYLYRKKLFESPSMHNKSILTIIHTLHEKNKREEMHAYRVSLLCEGIGRALGFNELKVKELKHLGLLHDIGKIAINEQLLNKPGKLTQEEWFEMTKHPEIGYRILSTVNEMSEMAESVLCHHERYDGKGYPRGIDGINIPINARIICIADAYDAMISDRPYRMALSHEKAIEELRMNSGTQFDPVIVLAFINMMTNSESVLLDHTIVNLISELDILFK